MAKVPRWLRVEFFLGLLFLGLTFYALLVEPFLLRVETPNISSPRLSQTLGASKIVFLSDLYSVGIGYREKQLVEEIEKIKPELILIGGGIGIQNPTPLRALLNVLTHDRTVYAVLGPNDDTSKEALALLQEEGVIVLRDERVEFLAPNGPIHIIGVGWPGSLPRLLEDPESEQPTIVLASTPDVIAPIADAFLLEAAQKPDDAAVDWRTSKGSWRFEQPNTVTITKSGPHRIRLQRAVSGLILAELRLSPGAGEPIVLEGKDFKEAGLRGDFQKLPGSAFGRQGMLLDASGAAVPITAAMLSPSDSAEITVELAAGVYQIEALVRTRGQGAGAVWIQVEDGINEKKQPRYQLGDNAAFPRAGDGVDLIVTGGTQGGKVRPVTFFEKLFFAKNHSETYWSHLDGLFTEGESPMYVTRGVGTTGVPARMMAPPELTVLTFAP